MRTYVLPILLFSGIMAFSQDCESTLSGSVKDSHDHSPLVGATLIIAETEQAVQTDFDGNFEFKNLCNDRYSVQVSHPNCLTGGFTISINGDTKRVFELEHHLEELNQVTVAGKAFRDKTKTLNEVSIANENLERFSSRTLGDALNSLSGVSSLNTGNTVVKPLVHGLHSSRVVLINNGVRMEDQEWGAEHAPNVDINAAGNLTLIKGAGALQYSGDAIGGIIVAEAPKIPIKDTLFGKTIFTAATNGRGTALSSQLTRGFLSGWHVGLQGTLKGFGDFEAPRYMLSNTGTRERNGSIHFGRNKISSGFDVYYSIFQNEIGILRASHLRGAQDQIRAIESDVPLIITDFGYSIIAPRQEVTHHLARAKYFRKTEKLGTFEVHYDFQQNNRLEFDIRRGDDKFKPSLDLQLNTHTAMVDWKISPVEGLNVKAGLMGRFQKNYANPATGVRRLIPDYKKYDTGVYGIGDYSINNHFIVEAGGRFDYTFMDVYKYYRSSFWQARNYDVLFPEIVVSETENQILTHPKLHFYNASATAGITYSFSPHFKLRANYSLASRAPNPSELFSEGLHHSAARIELGDLRFKPEVGNKIAVTLQKEGEKFNFSISPFLNSIRDFIVIEPTGIQQTVRGNFQVWEYRQTQAQLLGFDFDASYSFAKNFTFSHQFSMVKGYDRSKDLPLISLPPVDTKNELVYSNTNWKTLRLSLESVYVFRQNEYPNTNFDVYIPTTETTQTLDLSTPPGAYHLLNFNSSVQLRANAASTLTLGFGIENLLNTSYRNYLNRLRYYADDLGRNFLLTLKLNY